MATSDQIEYRTAEQNDKDIIMDIVFDVVCKSEVILTWLKTDGRTEGRPFAERHVTNSLRDDVSIVAVDKDSGQIVGFMLNSVEDKITNALDIQQKVLDTNDKLTAYFNIIEQVSGNVEYFERFKVEKIFYFRVLCVLPGYKQRGIAKSLVCRSLKLWEETGVPLSRVVTTSFFSRRIFQSLGFDLFAERRYDEIMLHGEPVLVDEKVHTTVSIWTKRLKVQ